MAVQSGNPSIRDVSDPFDVTDKPVRRYEDAKATRLGLEKVGAAGLETAGLTDVNPVDGNHVRDVILLVVESFNN